MTDADAIAAAKLRAAFRLYEVGVRMQRQIFERRHPEASEEEIDRLIHAWLRECHGAEHGDAEGRVVQSPRQTQRQQ